MTSATATLNDVASVFLLLMPIGFAAKMVAFVVITRTLSRQDNMTPLGAQIRLQNRWLSHTSLSLAVLFAALAWKFYASSGLYWWLPFMAYAEASSWKVTIHSWRMLTERKRIIRKRDAT